jgi:hypothetical protein
VARVATNRRHRGVTHRVRREIRGCVGMAVAALNCAGGNMRRRGVAGRGGAVVTGYAICIRRLVNVCRACPTRKSRGCTGVADDAIPTTRWDVTRIRCRAVGAFRSLSGVDAVVTGVAAATADRRMVHGVGGEARRRIGVTIIALHDAGRNMRRRGHSGGGGAVVAARAIGVAGLVDVRATGPTGETGRRLGMAGDAIAAAGRDVAGVRRSPVGAFCPLTGIRTVVAGVAASRAHRRMVHRIR